MKEANRLLKFDIDSREVLLSGVNLLANAVKVTMGPRGRNVVIEQPTGPPILTKDGVTVARAINLRDQFPNLGVQMIKEAASRTAEVAGDGTTAATVLSQAIFSEGIKMLAAGFQASEIKSGIDYAVIKVIENLKNMAIDVTNDQEIEQIGTISANGEKEIGILIVDALAAVGKNGVVTVEEAKGFSTSLSVVEGFQVDRGYLSPYFITNQDKMSCHLKNPYVLLCKKKIASIKDIMPILEKILNAQASILIIADDVDGDAMQGLVLNRLKGVLEVCAIRSPGFGENSVSMMDDLGVLLNCDVISEATSDDLKTMSIEDLGRCKKAIINKFNTVLVGCQGNEKKISNRIKSLNKKAKDPSLNDDEKRIIESRLSRLSGGVAILRVGGATEVELGERRDRVDDALNSTRAAIEEGILPGGGVSLVRAAACLDVSSSTGLSGHEAGIMIVKKACTAPLRQIVENTGGTPDIVLNKVEKLKKAHGYNAATDEYGDMFEMGIIDPLKVVRCALENAGSAAGMMLTVGCTIVDDNIESS